MDESEKYKLRACLQANGFLPNPEPPAPQAPYPSLQSLSLEAQPIWAALTGRPLNDRQIGVLEIYLQARATGEPPLSVHEVGRHLAEALGLDPTRASDFVRGVLRSFGRRLLQTLKRPPVRIGQDGLGNGVANEVPLLALLGVSSGSSGEVRHRLTDNGAAAVAAALAMTSAGKAAGGIQTGDPDLDDPNEIVTIGMTRLSAALVFRVQRSFGCSIDETIQRLTAKAGAG
jgi:hypothetical protein